MDHRETKNDRLLQFIDSKSYKVHSYITVPPTSTKRSCNRHSMWIKPLVEVVSDRHANKAGATKTLVCRDNQAVTAGIKEMDINMVQPMNAVFDAAMWKANGIAPQTAQRMLRRYLRHRFGHAVLPPEQRVVALHEGHVPANTKNFK